MVENREPTKRELAVQHYAEEVRRKEVIDDAARLLQAQAFLLDNLEHRRQLIRRLDEVCEAQFHIVQQTFKEATE